MTRATTGRLLIAIACCGTSGCLIGGPSEVEQAELAALRATNVGRDADSVSCHEDGSFAFRGATVTGYTCTVHGGSDGGARLAVYWNGRRLLTREERNALTGEQLGVVPD
jgi:hypothetical protein